MQRQSITLSPVSDWAEAAQGSPLQEEDRGDMESYCEAEDVRKVLEAGWSASHAHGITENHSPLPRWMRQVS